MPGGRLTHEHRRQIAAGLADGLGYAEIARQLSRPTSTISREVARNGGPAGYRADHAHYATGSRARRSKPAAEPDVPAELDEYGRDPLAVREYTEHFAEIMVATGVPRMASRVLACLYTTDAPSLTSADLVRQLRVSPASVSKAISYLESVEMVVRERVPRSRHEQYVIDDDVWLKAWLASARKTTSWGEIAHQGVELLNPGTPAGARLDKMSRFFAQLGEDMSGGPTMEIVDDALTLLAALVQVGGPLTTDQLTAALGWSEEQLAEAVRIAEKYADLIDPVTLKTVAPGTYRAEAIRTRLTPAQRKALRRAQLG